MGSGNSAPAKDTCSGCASSDLQGQYVTLNCEHLYCATCCKNMEYICKPNQADDNPDRNAADNDSSTGTFTIVCPTCKTVKQITNFDKAIELLSTLDAQCPQHKLYPIKLHCRDCQTAMCYECFTLDHVQHEQESLGNIMAELYPQLMEELEAIEKERESRQHRLNRLTETMEMLTNKYKDIMKAAEADTEVKVTTLRDNLEALRKQVDQDRDSVIHMLETKKSELENNVAEMDKLLPWKQLPAPSVNQGTRLLGKLQGEILPRALDLNAGTKHGRGTTDADSVGIPEYQACDLDLSNSAGSVKMVKRKDQGKRTPQSFIDNKI